jgi:hypothetical protein
MPALKNQRQERFCQLVVQGIAPFRAYPMAGYEPHDANPYRLSGNERVKARLAELTRGFAMKTRVTVETISEQLDADRDFARRVDQAGPALNATIAKAKLHGLIVDRKETGAPGDFAALSSADDVLALVRKELGDEAAALLLASLARSDALPGDACSAAERDPSEPLN